MTIERCGTRGVWTALVALLGGFAWLAAPSTVTIRAAQQSPPAAGSPTFSTDVAPIMYAKCVSCHRVYPIRDEIPVMMIDEATIEDEAPA